MKRTVLIIAAVLTLSSVLPAASFALDSGWDTRMTI